MNKFITALLITLMLVFNANAGTDGENNLSKKIEDRIAKLKTSFFASVSADNDVLDVIDT